MVFSPEPDRTSPLPDASATGAGERDERQSSRSPGAASSIEIRVGFSRLFVTVSDRYEQLLIHLLEVFS
jgi:hypothetical protein